jgi:carnitine-CoA ligase
VIALRDRTLVGFWRAAVTAAPDDIFLQSQSGELSFSEVDILTNRLANGLAGTGLVHGARIALMLSNSVEFVASFLASAKLGAVYVPINTEYKGDILRHQLNRAEVTHIIIDAAFLYRIADLVTELQHLLQVIIVSRNGEAATVQPAGLTCTDFATIAAASPDAPPAIEISHIDPLAISFTSGTTGPSKGVLASNCHVITFAMDWIDACAFSKTDSLYSCLPMFHAIATWLGVIPSIINRTRFAFAEKFSASRFWDDVRTYDASVVHGIFAMVPLLLKQPPSPLDADVPARLFYIGQRNTEFEKRFNCRIVEVYGATETGIVTMTPLDKNAPAGSCGKENSRSYEVALLDDDDNGVAIGEPGEICVRPRQPHSMFHGYYGMAEETVAAWRNLWFHTGDNAKCDEHGFYYFVDRKKDAIRRRGENISSYELEVVVNSDPRVLECAAIALPSELGEDEVCMIIVPQQRADLSPQDVWDTCDARMPRFWVPRFLQFCEELPKTPNGKVQKYLLRQGLGKLPVHDRMSKKG